MKIVRTAAGASIAAPAGLHIVPPPVQSGSGDAQLLAPLYNGSSGVIDRCVVVAVTGLNTISLVEYQLLGNTWVFVDTDCATDLGITLSVSATAQSDITIFAIDSPAGTSDRVCFVCTHDAAQTPDTFEIFSIVLTPGSESLTAVLSVVTGANQPTDTNGAEYLSIPTSVSRVITFHQDDASFGDITEAAGVYTFTYADAKVLAVDTSMDVDQTYSGVSIGSQVCMMRAGTEPINQNFLWEMDASAVLVEEFNPFAVGSMRTHQSNALLGYARVTVLDGNFAIAGPFGGSDASGEEMAYLVTSFPLDDI